MSSGSTTTLELSDLLVELYDLSADLDFYEHVMRVLSRRIPARIYGCLIVNQESRTIDYKKLHSNHVSNFPKREDLESSLELHPFVDYICNPVSGPVVCTTDLMSESEWTETPLFKKLYDPLGVCFDTCLHISVGIESICFNFADSVPMGTDPRRLLNLVVPHLSNVYRTFDILQKGWLSSLPEHMLVTNSSGDLIHCSNFARALLKKYYSSHKDPASLALPRKVKDWIISSDTDLSANRRRYSLRETCSEGTLHQTLIQTWTGYLVILEESPPTSDADLLTSLGLTQREAEVLVWVSQGKQNSDVASILQISTATVRKHMEHILHKLNCETRGAASRYALQILQGTDQDA